MSGFAGFFQERNYGLFVFDDSQAAFRTFDEARESGQWKECGLQVNVFAIPSEKTVLLPMGSH
jgi:hypothetical protein